MIADSGPATTAGVIAVGNLTARIDGQVSRAPRGRLTVGERAELVDLLTLRGHVLGRIADTEQAAALADELVGEVPGDARSFVARARVSGVFHRFASALTDLDTAAALGGDRVDLEAERAAIYQAEARYDELLERHQDAFADHAAEFWLTIGGDPGRALLLAQHNLSLRQTPRARALVRRSSSHPPVSEGQQPQARQEQARKLFLASDEARYITGVTLPVDAGFLVK